MAEPNKSRRREAQSELERLGGQEEVELSDLLDEALQLTALYEEAGQPPPTPEQNQRVRNIVDNYIEKMRWQNGRLLRLREAPDEYKRFIDQLRELLKEYPNKMRRKAKLFVATNRRARGAAPSGAASAADADAGPGAAEEEYQEDEQQARTDTEARREREAAAQARQRGEVAVRNAAQQKERDTALAAIEKAIDADDAKRRSDDPKAKRSKAPARPEKPPKRFTYGRVMEALAAAGNASAASGTSTKGAAKKKKGGDDSDEDGEEKKKKRKSGRSGKEKAAKEAAAGRKAAKAAEKQEHLDVLVEFTNNYVTQQRKVPALTVAQVGELVSRWNVMTTGGKNYNCLHMWPEKLKNNQRRVSGGLSKKQLEDCYNQDPNSEFARPAAYERMYKYKEGSTANDAWPDRYSSERLTEADENDPTHQGRFSQQEDGPVYASTGQGAAAVQFPNYADQSLSDPGTDANGVAWTVSEKNRGLSPGRSDQSIYWSAFAQYFTTTHERLIAMAYHSYEFFKDENGNRTVASGPDVEAALQAMGAANQPGATEEQKKKAAEAMKKAFWVHSEDYINIQEYLDAFDFTEAPTEWLTRYETSAKVKQFLGNGLGMAAWLRFVAWHKFVESADGQSVERIVPGDLDDSDAEHPAIPMYDPRPDDFDPCDELYVSLERLTGAIFEDPDHPAPATAGRNYNNSIPKTQVYKYGAVINAFKALLVVLNDDDATEQAEIDAKAAVNKAMFGENHAQHLYLYPWLARELGVAPFDSLESLIAAVEQKIAKDEKEWVDEKAFKEWLEKAKKQHDLSLRVMAGFCLPVPGTALDGMTNDAKAKKQGIDMFWNVMYRDFYPVWRRRKEKWKKGDGNVVDRGIGRIEGLFKKKEEEEEDSSDETEWGVEWFDKKHFDEFDAYGYLKWEKSKPTPDRFDLAHRKAMSPDLYTLMKRRYTEEMLADEVREAEDLDERLDLTPQLYKARFEPGNTHVPLGADRNDDVERRAYGAGAYRPDRVRNERDFGRERGPWVPVPGGGGGGGEDDEDDDGGGSKPAPKKPAPKKPAPKKPQEEEEEEEEEDGSDSDEAGEVEDDGSMDEDKDADPDWTVSDDNYLRKELLPKYGSVLLGPFLTIVANQLSRSVEEVRTRLDELHSEKEANDTTAAMEISEADAVRQEGENFTEAQRASMTTLEQEQARRAAEAEEASRAEAEAEAQRQRDYDNGGKAAGKRKVAPKGNSPNPNRPRPGPPPPPGPGGASSSRSRPVSAGFGPRFQMTLRGRLNAVTGKRA